MENYVKRYGGAKNMYPTARAYRKVVHDHYKTIIRSKIDVADWLDQYHSLLWYRSAFNPAIKCDYVTNNIAESFNNWIKDIKDLFMCKLADKVRDKIMELFHRRRRIGWMLQGKILPAILRVLKARTRALCHLSYVKGDNYIIEVHDNGDCHSKYVVRALLLQCQCQEW
jgi:hypothetical protein